MIKINPANRRNISQSPDVMVDASVGVQMFFQKILIELVYKQNEDGFLEEFVNPIYTMGVRISMTSRQLAVKPEGERKWKWSTLYTVPFPEINVDDIIQISGIKYRVMSSQANQEYGCRAYELLEDYLNAQ